MNRIIAKRGGKRGSVIIRKIRAMTHAANAKNVMVNVPSVMSAIIMAMNAKSGITGAMKHGRNVTTNAPNVIAMSVKSVMLNVPSVTSAIIMAMSVSRAKTIVNVIRRTMVIVTSVKSVAMSVNRAKITASGMINRQSVMSVKMPSKRNGRLWKKS